MERIFGASSMPPAQLPMLLTPPHTPGQPLLLTGKLWSKRCVIKWQSKQDLFGHVMGLAGEALRLRWQSGMNENSEGHNGGAMKHRGVKSHSG